MVKETDNKQVINYKEFMSKYCYIITPNGEETTLKLNDAQQEFYETIGKCIESKRRAWFIVLKARQLGFSTFTEGLGCTRCILKPNTKMLIMAHNEKASNNLYLMMKHFVKRIYDTIPNKLLPKIVKDNDSQLMFDNGSRVTVMIASQGNEDSARSFNFNYVHLSEFDFWACDKEKALVSILSACTDDTIVVIESTANGYGTLKNRWDQSVQENYGKINEIDERNKSGFIPKFYAWYKNKKYVNNDYPPNFELDSSSKYYGEKELVEKYNLTRAQLWWRRTKIDDFNGDLNKFHQEFPTEPEEAFLSSGECVFNKNSIQTRLYKLREEGLRYYDLGYYTYKIGFNSYSQSRTIYDIEWVSDKTKGYIKKYKSVSSRRPYVASIDPSGDGSDFSACVLLDNITAEQIVVLHKEKISSFDLACQCYCLGLEYNESLLSSETNYAPEVITYLKELEYPNIYVTQQADTNINVKVANKLGLRTSTITRPIMIAGLKEYINDNTNLINDFQTLIEAQNFVRVEKYIDGKVKWKEQANAGAHDDILMSLAGCLYIRQSGQQIFTLFEEEKPNLKTREQIEYERIFGPIEDDEDINEGVYMMYD